MIEPIHETVRNLLRAQLKKLDLHQAQRVEELFKESSNSQETTKGRFLIPEKLCDVLSVVCGKQMQLQTHGMIFDRRVNTVGIIFVCPTDPEKVSEAVGAALRSAMSLSHTLKQYDIPMFVELTIAIFETTTNGVKPSKDEARKCMQKVVKILRNYMLESSYLHSIGVHVWPTPADETAGSEEEQAQAKSKNRRDRSRVFPWLLNSTRNWYQSNEFQSRFANEEHHDLQSLTLENFRVAGKRTWQLNRPKEHSGNGAGHKSKVHLIHGHNGTGKSTISEAIELWMTGRVERLGQGKDYTEILVNRECSEATLEFKFDGLSPDESCLYQQYKVVEEGIQGLTKDATSGLAKLKIGIGNSSRFGASRG